MVHANQADYYRAIHQSTEKSDSAPFIQFILERILESCIASHQTKGHKNTPQASPQITPQAEQLLAIMQGEKNREELQAALGLKDRKSFREK